MPEPTTTNPADRTERDRLVLLERIAGDSLREIGGRHGLSPEGVRVVVARESTRAINQIELELMVAARSGEDDAVCFLVPFQEQTGWSLALSYFQFVLDQLRSRGLQVAVSTRHTSEGTAFVLEQEHSP